jgi:adenylate kinase family enzyme
MDGIDASTRPRRILVVGSTGAGKSTVAARLSAHYGLPNVHLDALHWGPNWTIRAEFQQEVTEWIARDEWVMEGGYRFAVERAWRRADLVVWLDLPFSRVLWQLLARTVRRRMRNEELFGGNRESLRTHFLSKNSLILWLMKSYRKRRRQYAAMAAQFPAVSLVRMTRRRDIDEWLERLD